MHPLDLTELALLDAVVRGGSLSAAARGLGVSQQAVSARIRGIERRIGIGLLVRGQTGTVPTAAGDRLLLAAREVLVAADRLSEVLAELRGAAGRSLRVAASQTIAAHLLPGWLLALRRDRIAQGRDPVATSLRTENSEQVLRLVRDGAVDVGFVEAPTIPDGFGTRAVHRDRLVAVVPPEHPWASGAEIGLAELAGTGLVVREEGSGTRAAYEFEVRRRLGRTPAPPVAVLATEAAIRSAVAGGLGPAVLSEFTVEDDVRLGRVRALPVRDADLGRPLTAVWSGGERDLFGAARELVEAARTMSDRQLAQR